jgi:hypothetical protein
MEVHNTSLFVARSIPVLTKYPKWCPHISKEIL